MFGSAGLALLLHLGHQRGAADSPGVVDVRADVGIVSQAGMMPVPKYAFKTAADDRSNWPLVETFHDPCEVGSDRTAHSAGAVAYSAKIRK